jgi:hypothetical protein
MSYSMERKSHKKENHHNLQEEEKNTIDDE